MRRCLASKLSAILTEEVTSRVQEMARLVKGKLDMDVFQNILKPVVRSVKFIVLATLMTVFFSSAMAILGSNSQVYANPLQSQQANHLQISSLTTSPSSIVGTWKGSLYHQGDDALTSVEMVINQGAAIKQGTWKFIGDTNSPLDSGTVVASLAGNNANLEFKQKNKKPSWFYKCKLQNNKKFSCEEVGNTSWKLTLNKAS